MGNNNVVIGRGAGMKIKDESNKVIIGHGVELDSDNVVRIGQNVVFSKEVWEAICRALAKDDAEFGEMMLKFTHNGIQKLREEYKDRIDDKGNLYLGFHALGVNTTGTESAKLGETISNQSTQ